MYVYTKNFIKFVCIYIQIMEIRIRKFRKQQVAVLISFNTIKEKFKSASERNRFYWGLYGRKQVIIRDGKRYEYSKHGLLDEIPNIKVDNSVFIIAEKYLRRIEEYFERWKGKVEVKYYPVILTHKEIKRLIKIKFEG